MMDGILLLVVGGVPWAQPNCSGSGDLRSSLFSLPPLPNAVQVPTPRDTASQRETLGRALPFTAARLLSIRPDRTAVTVT